MADTIIGQETNRALLIRVKNAPELARSQGALASFAQALAPATVEAKVYDTMKAKLKDALRKENVDADITVVEPSAYKAAGMNHVWTDVAFAIGGAGLAMLLYGLVVGGKKK